MKNRKTEVILIVDLDAKERKTNVAYSFIKKKCIPLEPFPGLFVRDDDEKSGSMGKVEVEIKKIKCNHKGIQCLCEKEMFDTEEELQERVATYRRTGWGPFGYPG